MLDSISVHHQESSTVHTAKPVWHIPIAACAVLDSWWWTEKLSETCTVLFQNKFEKLMRLVGFITSIYHDVRSSECRTFPAIGLATNVIVTVTIWQCDTKKCHDSIRCDFVTPTWLSWHLINCGQHCRREDWICLKIIYLITLPRLLMLHNLDWRGNTALNRDQIWTAKRRTSSIW